MSFFDSKEEVINIELTQFGKKLLSKGKFKPVYYAFFDDDVIYDSKYMGINEEQNDTQQRILNETPVSKPVYNFHSIEEEQKSYNDLIFSENLAGLLNLDKIDMADGETNYSLLLPLGQSSANSEFYPAWNLNVLNGQIFNCFDTVDNTLNNEFTKYPYLKIPQINMSTSSIKLKVFDENNASTQESLNLTTLATLSTPQKIFYIKRGETFNIFDVLERNVEDKKENFEIEVFLEDKKEINGQEKKYWKKLNFLKSPVNIKNGILLDEPLYQEAASISADQNFVSYYLNLLVDEEINLPPETLLSLNTYSTTVKEDDKPFGDDC